MARPREHDGSLYQRGDSKIWWVWYRDRNGKRRFESTFTEDWDQAQKKLRERLQARDENILEILRQGEKLLFNNWADFSLENFSRPPLRASKTHEANLNALKHLKPVFGNHKLAEMSADQVEDYLRWRLRQRKCVRTRSGSRDLGNLKPATVHQELRVLRRILNVAVKKRLIPVNPCSIAEFPVTVKSMFRPHYVTWSEQQRIESHAPRYLRNVIRIITETGLRIYKELAPMRKDQVDLANGMVWIPDSKTPNGVAEVPLTELALEAFRDQIAISGNGSWLFPNGDNPEAHQKSFKTAWRASLRRAEVPYFRIYDLRSTYATRLSAGGVADEWVIQLLRQGDSKVFKKYSQMKLQMKREAHVKLNRRASELELDSVTVRSS